MGPTQSSNVFLPISRAIAQFDDPACRSALFGSIAWSFVCFAALHVGAIWAVHRLLDLHGWVAWIVDIFGSVAAAIGTMYIGSIASAVERRFYPWLGPAEGASIIEQTWDGIAVALKVLAFNIVALLLTFLLPGVGLILGWMIAAYAIGRGLFVAVAMQRMPRPVAESLYRSCRSTVLVQGGILAAAAYIPILNLFIPIVGTAAMVHILDIAVTTENNRSADQFGTV